MVNGYKWYERIAMFFGDKKHLILFYIVSFTWGLIASLLGLLLIIPFVLTRRVRKVSGRLYGVFPKVFGSGWGYSLGCFFFTSYDCECYNYILSHEMGHGLQNILFGPLMLFVIGIPSTIRFWYRALYTKITGKQPEKSYESIWFENQASYFGNRFIIIEKEN